MTKLNCLLCISAVLVSHIALVAAERDSKTEITVTKSSGTATTQPQLRGEYALIAAQTKLTDKQKIQLAAIVMERRDAEARMRAAKQEKLDGLKQDLAEARKTKNMDAISTILQQMMRINAAESKAKKAFAKRVMELLTPEQKTKWAGFVLYRFVCKTLSKTMLTDDQKIAVRGLCDDAALELGDDALKTSLKRTAAQKKLRDKIKAEILTDQQRKAMGSRPAKPVRPSKKPVKKPPAKRT